MSKHIWPLKALKSGKSAVTLFEIRLDNNFLVFRGDQHESAGQLLKGHVVLCLSSPLKLDELHLRLTGTLRLSFSQTKVTASGMAQHKVDKTVPILQHRWKPFVGGDAKGTVLQPGNYEFPFEYMLPGDTCETLEGIPEASISYRLKARVVRSRLASNIHTYKHVRVIRTLEPSALEFLHAMSVENIWTNKVEYSIAVPQKAVVFGGTLPLQMRLTPLLKGLELGDIQARLLEIRECSSSSSSSSKNRECRVEREVGKWKFAAGSQHWHDMIEDTGQEGWVIEKKLDLPKKLRQCTQDFTRYGVKVRHKVKLTIGLQNPDGHVSELRATLPVSLFISPNIPLDEEGNLVTQPGDNVLISEEEVSAPPGYGQHVLDQLYDDVVYGGFQTPEDRSGANSPYYQPSALASSEDLTLPPAPAPADANPDAMAALATRLQRMTDARSRRNSVVSLESSRAHSEGLSRQISNEDPAPSPGSAEHDEEAMETLNKVPSYATAVRTPARPRSLFGGAAVGLPMYEDIEAEPESARGSEERPSTSAPAPADGSPEPAGGRRAARSRPTSGLPDALVSRLASHGYFDQRLDSRSYLVGQDLRCI